MSTIFYEADSNPHTSISIDQPLNWVYFLADTFGRDDYYPPIARDKTQDRSAADWRSWCEQVWDLTSREGADLTPPDRDTSGWDPDEFISMSDRPRLRARCAQEWPAFIQWWRIAKPMLSEQVNAVAVHRILSQARPSRGQLYLHVVALRDGQDLASHRDHHLISIGLLQDAQLFENWLSHQV